jgi:hypothetical protein
MFGFGAGVLLARQRLTAAGAVVTNPTPIQFGTLQDVSVDMSFERKLLHGSRAFPVAAGRGKGSISCKATFADFNGRVFGDMFLGTGTTAQIRAAVVDFAANIPTTPFQVTVAPPSSGTFAADFGVRLASTGLPMTRVASAPAVGQYSVNEATGVYTFASGDTGAGVLISYEYTATSTTARVSTISNQLMGSAPEFEVLLSQPYGGKQLTLRLVRCQPSKMMLAFKNDDFTLPDFEFDALADASDNIGYIATSE